MLLNDGPADSAPPGIGQYYGTGGLFTFEASFMYFFRADLATRGLAISFLTPASVALPDSFLALFLGIHP